MFIKVDMLTDSKILLNKTIVVTRSVEDSGDSCEKFKNLGANVISFPTIDIIPPDDWYYFDKNLKKLNNFDLLIFTSANTVKMFIKRCTDLKINADYKNLKVAVIGGKTALECVKHNIAVDILPEEFSSEGLLFELLKYELKGKNVFIPGSALAREELPNSLMEKGANVITAPVYNLSIPSEEVLTKSVDELKNNKPDLFIFTSPSTFRNFLQIMNIFNPQNYFNGTDVAAIGPVTKAELEKYNVHVNIFPDKFTMADLVQSVIEYYTIKE